MDPHAPTRYPLRSELKRKAGEEPREANQLSSESEAEIRNVGAKIARKRCGAAPLSAKRSRLYVISGDKILGPPLSASNDPITLAGRTPPVLKGGRITQEELNAPYMSAVSKWTDKCAAGQGGEEGRPPQRPQTTDAFASLMLDLPPQPKPNNLETGDIVNVFDGLLCGPDFLLPPLSTFARPTNTSRATSCMCDSLSAGVTGILIQKPSRHASDFVSLDDDVVVERSPMGTTCDGLASPLAEPACQTEPAAVVACDPGWGLHLAVLERRPTDVPGLTVTLLQEYRCDACKKDCGSASALKVHIRRVHPADDSLLHCSYCDKTCKRMDHLRIHMASRTKNPLLETSAFARERSRLSASHGASIAVSDEEE
ncbi:hypothetical protein BV898_18049 [Hypsibius exemplaris]|uniref:C2H2-type domain-containing protein n=1 Tax=Hypsibius exemplaris TaxID=2072580 RepID=A0A9X6RMS7_HYPEX|nr:hypothetical protein BV898_18049 [Hypsibius exemplaris]